MKACTLWFCWLFVFGYGVALAQTDSVAVVTRIEQIVRLSPALRSAISEESFPDYLTQPEFQNSIFQTIQTSLSRKFPVSKVEFRQPAGHWLDFQNVVAPLHIDRNRGDGHWFVAVQQVIQLNTTAADSLGMPVKNFQSFCTVQVEDKDGKSIFSNKVTAPFRTVSRPGQMTGTVEISRDDWIKLLATVITAAFTGKEKRLPMQICYRPPLEIAHYNLKDNSTAFFVLQETEKGSNFRGATRQKTLIFGEAGRMPTRWQYEQSYSLSESYLRGEYRTRILLQDSNVGTEYDITAVTALTRDSLSPISKTVNPIQIRCTAQRLLVGDYTMTPRKFEGQVGYDVYTIRPVAPRNTFEVRINDKVRALIQKGGSRPQGSTRRQDTYFHISREANENVTDKIMLSYLIYQMATELGREFLGY